MSTLWSLKTLRRILLGSGGLLVLLLLVLQFNIVSVFLRDAVEDVVNEAIEQELRIVRLKLKPLRFRMDVEGVSITDDTGAVTVIPSASIRFQLPFNRPLIRTIVINNPSVQVYIDGQQDREEITLPEDFPFENIQINNADIQIDGDTYHYENKSVSLNYHKGVVNLWTKVRSVFIFEERAITVQPFQVEDVFVAPNLLTIDRLSLETSLFDCFGSLELTEQSVSGELGIYAQLSRIIPRTEERSVDGRIAVTISPRGSLSDIVLDGDLELTDFIFQRQGRDRWLRYAVSNLNAGFSLSDRRIEIDQTSLPWAGGLINIQGVIRPDTKEINLELNSQDTNFYELFSDIDLSIAPWVDLEFSSAIQLTGSYSPFRLEGDIHLQGENFITSSGDARQESPLLKVPNVLIDGTVYVDERKMIYDISNLMLDRTQGRARAEFDFEYPNIASIEYDFTQFDLSEMSPLGGAQLRGQGYVKGQLSGPIKALSIQSSGRIEGFSMVGIPYADDLVFQAKGKTLTDIEIQIPQASKGRSQMSGVVSLSFLPEIILQGEFSTEGGSANDFMSIFFTPLDVDATAIGNVTLRGPVSNLQVEADFDLVDARLWGEPFDYGAFHLRMNGDQMTIEEISFQRRDGIGSALMRGTRKDGRNNFEILVGALPIEYSSLLVEKNSPIRGKIDLFAKIQGESFIPSGTIQVRDIWYGLQPIGEGTILFFEQNDHMEYQLQMENALSVYGRSGYSLDDDFLFYFQSTEFPLHVLAQQSFNGEWITGELSAEGYVQQRDNQLSGKVTTNAVTVEWKDRKIYSPEPWTMEWAEDEIAFSPVHIVGSGKTNFVFQGKRARKQNDFQAGGQIDLRVLEMLLPYTRRANGLIDFTARLGQQGFMADVDLQRGFLEGDWFPHSIEDIYSSIQIFDNSYSVDAFQARVGGGEVELGGVIESESLYPQLFGLELRFSGSRLQLLDWLPAVLGDGELKVTGPFDYPMISGDIVLTEMNFTDRIDWENAVITFAPSALSGASEEGKGYFQYDINLRADDSIRIRNNLADMYASAELKFIGDLAKPGMLGTVTLSENGRALFKERDFKVLRGELRYDDPFSFDPMLDIAMQTVVNTAAQDYEIDYYVTDYYSQWQTHTSSNPALPQADINALLLFGMTREDLEIQGGIGSALAIEGSDILASKFGVVQRFNEVGEGIFQSELLRLDRIDLISGTTDRNSAYVSSALRLIAEKDIGNGTIRVEQSVTETSDIFLSWEQQIAKRLYTRLYWSSQQQGRYLNSNGAFGAEFELQWELD